MRLPLAMVMLCAACGPGSYGDFRSQLQTAACNWAERCGVAGRQEPASCPTDDVLSLLHDATADRATPGAVDIDGEVSAGRLGYDSVNAQNCIDAVSASPCDPVLALSKRYLPCSVVISSNVANGKPCWSDLECVGGGCVRAPGCAGICTAFASFGASCVADDTTPPQDHCDETVAWCGGDTTAPTCQRKKQSGVPCELDDECAIGFLCRSNKCMNVVQLASGVACGGQDSCKHGLYCDPTTLVCTPQSQHATTCTSPLGCQDGLACVGLHPVTPINGTPVPVPTPGSCAPWLTLGATCTDTGGVTGVVTGCPASETCTGGVCSAMTQPSVAGQSCRTMTCAPGLGCNTLGVCDYLRPLFGDCGSERAMLCEPGLVCSMDGEDLSVQPGHCIPADVPACFAPPAGDQEDAGIDGAL